MDLTKKLKSIIDKRNQFIEKNIDSFSHDISNMEMNLLKLVEAKITAKLIYENNQVAYNETNMNLVSKLDEVFKTFYTKYTESTFKDIGLKMLDLSIFSKEYFNKFGIPAKLNTSIDEGLNLIAERIGLNVQGEIIKDSYLYRLAQTDVIREQLKDYVAKSISTQSTLSDFQKGFKEIVTGTDQLDSKLKSYWETETHDAMYSVARASDDVFAQSLNLNFFLYLPDVEIKTSRPFCAGGYDKKAGIDFEPKIGKLFHRLEVLEWNNIDWSGKKFPYNPIVDMGGWNCQHQPYWITDEMAQNIDPEKYEIWIDKTE